MDFGAVFEIIFALLALVGIGCLGHYLSETLFLPREIVTSVRIFDDESRENADTLIHIAKHKLWFYAGRKVCIILSEKYARDEELVSLINESGLECYVIDEK